MEPAKQDRDTTRSGLGSPHDRRRRRRTHHRRAYIGRNVPKAKRHLSRGGFPRELTDTCRTSARAGGYRRMDTARSSRTARGLGIDLASEVSLVFAHAAFRAHTALLSDVPPMAFMTSVSISSQLASLRTFSGSSSTSMQALSFSSLSSFLLKRLRSARNFCSW